MKKPKLKPKNKGKNKKSLKELLKEARRQRDLAISRQYVCKKCGERKMFSILPLFAEMARGDKI